MATSVELPPIKTSGVAGRRPPKATFRLKNIETDGKAISWDFLVWNGFLQKMDRSMMDALKHVYIYCIYTLEKCMVYRCINI